jgi:hypothetical protein
LGWKDTDTTTKALAAFGLRAELSEQDNVFYLWPEHWPALRVFMRLRSQWQPGHSGVIGLRYESIPFVMDLESIGQSDRPSVMDDLQLMESTVLDILSKKD